LLAQQQRAHCAKIRWEFRVEGQENREAGIACCVP
jgi:hypothetical protein